MKKTGFVIRAGTVADVPVLMHNRRAMFQSMGIRNRQKLTRADRDYRKWAISNLKNGNLKAWIVETDDGMAIGSGCVWMQPVQPGPGRTILAQPYLLSMYTNPRYRRRGIASMIVNEAIEWCERKNFDRLLLHASETGRKVYVKFGFKPTREMRLLLPRKKRRRA